MRHAQSEMAGGMGGDDSEADHLSLYLAGGRSEVCVRRLGAREVPCFHADAGEFFWLQGSFLLRDVQPLPHLA